MNIELTAKQRASVVKMVAEDTIDWGGDDGEMMMEDFYHDFPAWRDKQETPKLIFNAWLKRWAERRIDDIIETLKSVATGESIRIWRVITAPKDWRPDTQSLGVFWSWDPTAAQAHWGNYAKGDVRWKIESAATPDQIDWPLTIALNAHPSFGEDEKEIRLRKGVRVPIVELFSEGRPVEVGEYAGRRFAANNPGDGVIYDKGGCRIEIVTPDAPGGLGKWRDTFIHFTDEPADAAAIAKHGFDLKKFGRTGRKYAAATHLTEHDPRGVYAHAWKDGAEAWGGGKPYVIFTVPVARAIYWDNDPDHAPCGKAIISQIHGGKTGAALSKALLKDGIQAIFSKHSEQIILDTSGIEFVGGHGIDY